MFLTLVMSLPARRCAFVSVTEPDVSPGVPTRRGHRPGIEVIIGATDGPRGGPKGPGKGEGPSKYELLGPSVDRRTVTFRSISLRSGPGCRHRAHRDELPRRVDLLLRVIRSPRRECVREVLCPPDRSPQGGLANYFREFSSPGLSSTDARSPSTERALGPQMVDRPCGRRALRVRVQWAGAGRTRLIPRAVARGRAVGGDRRRSLGVPGWRGGGREDLVGEPAAGTRGSASDTAPRSPWLLRQRRHTASPGPGHRCAPRARVSDGGDNHGHPAAAVP